LIEPNDLSTTDVGLLADQEFIKQKASQGRFSLGKLSLLTIYLISKQTLTCLFFSICVQKLPYLF